MNVVSLALTGMAAVTIEEKKCLSFEEMVQNIKAGGVYPAGSKSRLTVVERSKLNYVIANYRMEEEKLGKLCLSDVCTIENMHSESLTVNGREVGRATTKGRSRVMEDVDIAETFEFQWNEKKHTAEIFGIFDGHGGIAAANFLKENMVSFLKQGLEACVRLDEESVWNMFKTSFPLLNEQCPGDAGSTATVALILNGILWVANVGDSRAVLFGEGKASALTEDANPEYERYRRKVERDGSSVHRDYVDGKYANARAFGDKDSKGISAVPKIFFTPLHTIKPGSHLIIASDGLYEVSSIKQIDSAFERIRHLSAEEISKRLVDSAVKSKSLDNVSVLAVKL